MPKKSNAWAHVMAQVGGDALNDENTVNSSSISQREGEMNNLLSPPPSSNNYQERTLSGTSSFLKHDEYKRKEQEHQTSYGDRLYSSNSSSSSNHRTNQSTDTAARAGNSNCFKSVRSLFDLHQSVVKGEHHPTQIKGCFGAMSDMYSKSVEYYKQSYDNTYYGKQIEPTKLRAMADEIAKLKRFEHEEQEEEAFFENTPSNNNEEFYMTPPKKFSDEDIPQGLKRDSLGYTWTPEKSPDEKPNNGTMEWGWVLESLRETGETLGYLDPEPKPVDADKLKKLRDQAVGIQNKEKDDSNNVERLKERNLDFLKPEYWTNGVVDPMEDKISSIEAHLQEEREPFRWQ